MVSNMVYLESLINEHDPDVIALQEHWLFDYEQEKCGKLLNYNYHAKSVDTWQSNQPPPKT